MLLHGDLYHASRLPRRFLWIEKCQIVLNPIASISAGTVCPFSTDSNAILISIILRKLLEYKGWMTFTSALGSCCQVVVSQRKNFETEWEKDSSNKKEKYELKVIWTFWYLDCSSFSAHLYFADRLLSFTVSSKHSSRGAQDEIHCNILIDCGNSASLYSIGTLGSWSWRIRILLSTTHY